LTRAALILALVGLLVPARAFAAPNVVVVETDDQTVADLASMPRTSALIGGAGVTFGTSVVSLSQCCPSRATLLTGRYAHNHKVLSSAPPRGGAGRLDSSETLAVWLQRAGYATALVGKYLNGYGSADPFEVPPGWTEWRVLHGGSTYRYYDYTINHNGRLRTYGSGPGDYQTDVITGLAESVIRRRAPKAKPFFLWTAYVAPHTGQPRDADDPHGASAVPAPRHRDRFAHLFPPVTPAFDEADVSDKPAAIAARPPLGPDRTLALQESWRQRQESLLAVDEGVARIVRALRAAGELRNTLLVFTSDNGFMTGEHRLPAGKLVPYEPSIRVPLLMRGPGIPAGAVRTQPVWNGDVAPTILAAAGARAPWPLDGRSLWPLIRRPARWQGRDILLEGSWRRRFGSLGYTGLRTERYVYVEHAGGELELYDLERDPDELDNLAGSPSGLPVQAVLAPRLARLRTCRGVECGVRQRTSQPGAAYTRHDWFWKIWR
jgi:N-acetylglucosamine-6-sulfatase